MVESKTSTANLQATETQEPTVLETTVYSDKVEKKSKLVPIFLSCIFCGIVILIGIVVVCRTISVQSASPCGINFIPTPVNPIEYNYRPRSVAVGDFNLDGILDLAVANSAVDNIVIFLRYVNDTIENNSMTFALDAGSTPYMLAVKDLNDDNRLDIAVANYGTHTIDILVGLENQSFAKFT
ncbi:unnamed protein product, partial [Adineta ricciae]